MSGDVGTYCVTVMGVEKFPDTGNEAFRPKLHIQIG
jgi:hypothetical protein